MYWLIALALVALFLTWVWRLDHRGSKHGFGRTGADELRNRVEGNMVLGRDWKSGPRQ